MLTTLLISLGINGPHNKFNIELKNIRLTQKLARHLVLGIPNKVWCL